MKLFNTLTRQKEDFKPLNSNQVTLYTCGPTVYDYAHIGNLRAFVFDDLLRRTLEANYTVKHVMNITDVGHLASDADEGEDKLEKGAKREGKTVWQVAESYTQAFRQDAAALNILSPNGFPDAPDGYARATHFIAQQIDLVQRLIDKGFAYQTKQAIYFDVSKLPDYGKLTGQKLADKEVGARAEVVTDPHKYHPYDFALWFFTVGHFKDHTMHWPSPWGDGFPGWHLECSAIIHATLGENIDIHTGGVDHIGTHHTNEIAQSEAAFGQPLARFWLHNQFVLVNGVKMAKSDANFYTLKDIVKRGHHPLALRLLYLQAHYRSQLNFTGESLAAAENFLVSLYAWADLVYQPEIASAFKADASAKLIAHLKQALEDDLDSPRALAILSETAAHLNGPSVGLLRQLDQLLGLGLSNRADVNAKAKQLLDRRQQARVNQDYDLSDQLRDQLAKEGIEVDDTPSGPRWRRLKP